MQNLTYEQYLENILELSERIESLRSSIIKTDDYREREAIALKVNEARDRLDVMAAEAVRDHFDQALESYSTVGTLMWIKEDPTLTLLVDLSGICFIPSWSNQDGPAGYRRDQAMLTVLLKSYILEGQAGPSQYACVPLRLADKALELGWDDLGAHVGSGHTLFPKEGFTLSEFEEVLDLYRTCFRGGKGYLKDAYLAYQNL